MYLMVLQNQTAIPIKIAPLWFQWLPWSHAESRRRLEKSLAVVNWDDSSNCRSWLPARCLSFSFAQKTMEVAEVLVLLWGWKNKSIFLLLNKNTGDFFYFYCCIKSPKLFSKELNKGNQAKRKRVNIASSTSVHLYSGD